MRLEAAIFLVFLAGCSGCGQPKEQGTQDTFGQSFDESSQVTGIRVRLANDESFHPSEIDTDYADVAKCMGVDAPIPGPLFVYLDFFSRDYGDGLVTGRYYPATDTIVIDARIKKASPPPFEHVQSEGDIVVRHELIHAILYKITGDTDARHDSPYFEFGSVNCVYRR